MNEHTRKQLTRFMGIMKAMGLTKDEIFGICYFLKTEDMASEILEKLAKGEFRQTPREVMNIAGEVIEKNL